MSDEVPRRVRIESPRRSAPRASGARAVRTDIDEQTYVGEVYMRALLRSQLRLAVGVCVLYGVLLGGLPLLFATAPALADVHVLGVPLPWLVLGVLVYPAIVVGAWVYVRAAERSEREWVDLVERS